MFGRGRVDGGVGSHVGWEIRGCAIGWVVGWSARRAWVVWDRYRGGIWSCPSDREEHVSSWTAMEIVVVMAMK